MEMVYDRPATKVWVCVDCHSGLNASARAWEQAGQAGRVQAKSDHGGS